MRIIGGTLKGRTLFGFKGEDIRPTSDSARESLFNILGEIAGAEFLDLFAGTGAIGIEAISRGAKSDLNDGSKDSVALIKANCEHLGVTSRATITRSDAISFIRSSGKKYDIVFCDPPYKSEIVREVMNAVSVVLKDGGTAVLENDRPFTGVADGLYLKDVRRYGKAVFSFFGKREDGAAFYAGTFDPITKGHERSIRETVKGFGRTLIILGNNPEKEPFFSQDERAAMIESAFSDIKDDVEIVKFSDFPSLKEYSDFLKSRNALYFVRGIRDEEDFSYEKKAEKRNSVLYPDFITTYVFCEEEYKKYHSKAVKSALMKGKSVIGYIPDGAKAVFERIIKEKIKAGD